MIFKPLAVTNNYKFTWIWYKNSMVPGESIYSSNCLCVQCTFLMISVVMLIFSLYFAWLSINLVDLKECGKPGVQVLSTLIWISFWISWPHAAVLNFLIDPKVLLDIESWYMKWPQHLCIVIFFKHGLQGNPLMMSLFCPPGGSSVVPLGGIKLA